MRADSDPVEQRINCDCGEGYWRYLLSGTGLYCTQRKCMACGEHKLIVLRGDEVVGVTTLVGFNADAIHTSLRNVGALSPNEIRCLVENARSLGRETVA